MYLPVSKFGIPGVKGKLGQNGRKGRTAYNRRHGWGTALRIYVGIITSGTSEVVYKCEVDRRYMTAAFKF